MLAYHAHGRQQTESHSQYGCCWKSALDIWHQLPKQQGEYQYLMDAHLHGFLQKKDHSYVSFSIATQ